MSGGEPRSFAFPKSSRLLNRGDFRRVGRRGRRIVAGPLVFQVDRGKPGTVRLGITAARQSGDSVRRNRAKRLVRECFRRRRSEIAPGYDVVIVIRDAAACAVLIDVESCFDRFLRSQPFDRAQKPARPRRARRSDDV
ncbi:ribonuclease P protein component [bacterium]|nr:MAG: ribonuclease P protein component [Sphingopyxis terrae]MBZ0273715.1 ribonuclease P protein component [bacterium]